MKTTFKPARGHNYHTVHETKSGGARKSCWTLCGEYFGDGELSTHQPTCPDCRVLDNPLSLTGYAIEYLRDAARINPWRDAPRDKVFRVLLQCDYIDKDINITRRGRVLVDDLTLGAVPMADTAGVVHARSVLSAYSRCAWPEVKDCIGSGVILEGVVDMTVSRYEKLRKVQENAVISCLSCLSR